MDSLSTLVSTFLLILRFKSAIPISRIKAMVIINDLDTDVCMFFIQTNNTLLGHLLATNDQFAINIGKLFSKPKFAVIKCMLDTFSWKNILQM